MRLIVTAKEGAALRSPYSNNTVRPFGYFTT